MSPRRARRRAAGAAAARLPASSGGPGAHQLPVLAAAGYRAVAMDLRGYGGSDKTPRGYDPFTLAADVAGVVKALGARRAVAGRPRLGRVRRAGRPPSLHRARGRGAVARSPRRTRWRCCASCGPACNGAAATCWRCSCRGCPSGGWPTPAAATSSDHLRAWAGPGSAFPDGDASSRRTSGRSGPVAGLALRAGVPPLAVPVAAARRRPPVRPAMRQPRRAAACCDLAAPTTRRCPTDGVDRSRRARRRRAAPSSVLPGVGHFPHEEDPGAFDRGRLTWLRSDWLVADALGAAAGADRLGRGSDPERGGVGDLARGERVAGVVVGDRRGEDHAEHLAGGGDERAAGVAGPDQRRAARTPRG